MYLLKLYSDVQLKPVVVGTVSLMVNKIPNEKFRVQDWRVQFGQPRLNNTAKIADGKHIFRSEIPVGNFGVPFKTFRKFWKFSDREHQNSLTIYIPIGISEIVW